MKANNSGIIIGNVGPGSSVNVTNLVVNIITSSPEKGSTEVVATIKSAWARLRQLYSWLCA